MKFLAIVLGSLAALASSTLILPVPPVQTVTVVESYVQQVPRIFQELKTTVLSKIPDEKTKKELLDLLQVSSFVKTVEFANMDPQTRKLMYFDLPLLKKNKFTPEEYQEVVNGAEIQFALTDI